MISARVRPRPKQPRSSVAVVDKAAAAVQRFRGLFWNSKKPSQIAIYEHRTHDAASEPYLWPKEGRGNIFSIALEIFLELNHYLLSNTLTLSA